MGIFKKKKKDETAVTAVMPAEEKREEELAEVEYGEAKRPPAKKKGFSLGQIGDVVDVVKGVKSSFDEVYSTWIKPIMDNRAQIKRRWNGFVTAISVLFFFLYVPFLLFSKIAKGLSLGWDIALYTCIGVYVAAVIVMVIITVASGKSTSTQASKRWRKASSVILFIVRIASFALSITAILVSGNGESTAFDTILMVLAITSIVFTSLSLIFGGVVGFIKWLISPAKIRHKFSFVAFEWKQTLDEGKREQDKKTKKAYAKNAEKVAECLDKYLLPEFGKGYVDSVDGDKIVHILNGLPEEDRNVTEWVVKDLFDYAHACGYVTVDPCEELALAGDIVRERPPKPQKQEGGGSGWAALFRRKPKLKEPQPEEDDTDEE